MAQNIKINQTEVKANSELISKTEQYLSEETLSSKDNRTTLTANGKGQEAYDKSQKLLTALVQALAQEAVNIRSLGLAFQEYDEMVTNLHKSGSK